MGYYPKDLLEKADDSSFGTEFLSYKMSVKTVRSFDEAIQHIAEYSSKHSEAIISDDPERLSLFFKNVDAAAIFYKYIDRFY